MRAQTWRTEICGRLTISGASTTQPSFQREMDDAAPLASALKRVRDRTPRDCARTEGVAEIINRHTALLTPKTLTCRRMAISQGEMTPCPPPTRRRLAAAIQRPGSECAWTELLIPEYRSYVRARQEPLVDTRVPHFLHPSPTRHKFTRCHIVILSSANATDNRSGSRDCGS